MIILLITAAIFIGLGTTAAVAGTIGIIWYFWAMAKKPVELECGDGVWEETT